MSAGGGQSGVKVRGCGRLLQAVLWICSDLSSVSVSNTLLAPAPPAGPQLAHRVISSSPLTSFNTAKQGPASSSSLLQPATSRFRIQDNPSYTHLPSRIPALRPGGRLNTSSVFLMLRPPKSGLGPNAGGRGVITCLFYAERFAISMSECWKVEPGICFKRIRWIINLFIRHWELCESQFAALLKVCISGKFLIFHNRGKPSCR